MGLFAACSQSRADKSAQVRQLLRDHDVVIITETHSTPEGEALDTRNGQAYFGEFPAFWAHGSAARAGVGVVVTEAFLRRFDHTAWRVLVPGRAGELWLNGGTGDLSIFAVYFATGADELDEEDTTISARTSRKRMRQIVASHIAPDSRRLSLLMGDFNWVADDLGRIQLEGQQPSGHRDRHEEQHLVHLLQGTNMTLWRHTAYTHQHQGILSRLDRCYANLHPSCFLWAPRYWIGCVRTRRTSCSAHIGPCLHFVVHSLDPMPGIRAAACLQKWRPALPGRPALA